MGPAILRDDELTDDDDEDDDEVLFRSDNTLADLDPAQFAQLLANVNLPEEEEGQIPEQGPRQARYQPYAKPSLASQQPDRSTKRLMRGLAIEALKQVREARKPENTGKLGRMSCFMMNLSSSIVIIPGFSFEVAVGSDQSARRRMLDPQNKPSSTIEWVDGECPRRILSADGYDLVFHIPNGIKKESQVRLISYLL